MFGPKNMKTQHDFHKPDSASQSLLCFMESFKSTFVDYSESMAELPSQRMTIEQSRELLAKAALIGDVQTVKKIVSIKPPNIDLINSLSNDELGWAPLHFASDSGNVEIVELFIRKLNANVNLQTSKG